MELTSGDRLGGLPPLPAPTTLGLSSRGGGGRGVGGSPPAPPRLTSAGAGSCCALHVRPRCCFAAGVVVIAGFCLAQASRPRASETGVNPQTCAGHTAPPRMCRVSVTVRQFAMCARNDLGTLSIGRSTPVMYLPGQHAQRDERMNASIHFTCATASRELALLRRPSAI